MGNRVELIGNVGSDNFNNLKLKQFPGGSLCVNLTLATHYNTKDGAGNVVKQTEWHDLVAWGPIAQRIAQEMHPGDYVFVEGFLKSTPWVDQQGNQRRRTEVQVRRFLVSAKKATNNAHVATAAAVNNQPVIVDPNTLNAQANVATVVQPGPTENIQIPDGFTAIKQVDGSIVLTPLPPKTEASMGNGTAGVTHAETF